MKTTRTGWETMKGDSMKENENLYRINGKTGHFMIDIALDEYMDFFHKWDNAIMKKRDMNPELAEFLDLCSEDIPLKKGIDIHIRMEKENQDQEKEALIRDSYVTYYKTYFRLEKKKIRKLFKASSLLTITSTCLLLINYTLRSMLPDGIASDVILEGLMIGGWVFLWEAIHNITFERRESLYRYKELARFLKASILFDYYSISLE